MTVLLDQFGRELPRQRRGAAALGGLPYQAADIQSAEMRDWNAWLASPDVEINPFRDRIVARIRDLARNDGWAAGGITRIVDGAIGGDFRLVAKPDHRYLKRFAPGFDPVWADEFRSAVEAEWRSYAYDLGRWCDTTRRMTVPQMFRLAFRHKIVDGEATAALPWSPENIAPGRAGYATQLHLIDPDRLSNPAMVFDERYMRGGVEINDSGAAVAYWVRKAHQTDWFDGADAVTWERIPRETPHGRPMFLHDFDADRADQHRPAGGVLSPVLARAKMLAQYDSTELQAAVVNAIFAAYIESPFDHDGIQDALGDGENSYMAGRLDFHEKSRLRLNGARLPILYPGEKITTVAASRPPAGYEPFQHAALRNMAAAMGISAEQLSQDYSKTNYSSARAAMLEAWKTLNRRRADFSIGFATPFFAAWLEEAFDRADLPLPAGAPEFIEARHAYSACRWMGAARGWVDPVKEAQAAVLRMDAGLSSLEIEAAEQGMDWEEVIAQRAIEAQAFRDAKLPRPQWFGEDAGQAAQKPEKEQPQ